jgi:UrcA family protein
MNAQHYRFFNALVTPTLVIAGVMLTSHAVFAQTVSEITVIAPHSIEHKTVGRTYTGIPIEQISLSHHVSFRDLDLRRPADAAELNKRVDEAARIGCRELDGLYPLDELTPSNKTCTKSAIDAASRQVTAAIAAARP